MSTVLLNGRPPAPFELPAIAHGAACDQERELSVLAGVLTADPIPEARHEGRPVQDLKFSWA